MQSHRSLRLALLALVVVGLVAMPLAPSFATYEGENGAVVFARGGGIVRQAPNGTEKTLVSGIMAAPSYSADGKKIVYLRGSLDFGAGWYQVWMMNADGSGKKRLVGRVSRYESPSFSPDGQRVMFEEYDGNAMGIRRLHTVAVDGSGRKEFAPKVPGTMHSGVWSPDGRRVAYIGGPAGEPEQLRTIRSTGARDTIRKLAPKLTSALHPDWSPDGSRIVFSQFTGTNKRVIYRVNADKTGLRKLVDYGEERGADNAVWSPDGTLIIFDKANYSNGTNNQLWTMKPDGTDRTRIDANGFDPSWQPR